jgi:hypothetical protein
VSVGIESFAENRDDFCAAGGAEREEFVVCAGVEAGVGDTLCGGAGEDEAVLTEPVNHDNNKIADRGGAKDTFYPKSKARL